MFRRRPQPKPLPPAGYQPLPSPPPPPAPTLTIVDVGALLLAPQLALAGAAQLPASVSPDLYVLALPQAGGHHLLALLAYLGSLSAATGMMILSGLTLSIMLGNHGFGSRLLDGIAGGAAAAVVGWLLVTGMVMVGWFTAMAMPLPRVLGFAGQLWLGAHGAGATVGAVLVTLIPLGLSTVFVVLTRTVVGWRCGPPRGRCWACCWVPNRPSSWP